MLARNTNVNLPAAPTPGARAEVSCGSRRGGGDLAYADVAEDLGRLCDMDGIKTAKELGGIDQIVITLMGRPMERGASDPDATMFIGAYLPGEEGCIWQ